MKKHLHILQVLVYYDVPEIFIATDEVNTKFLCLLVDLFDNSIIYISTPISSERLSAFINGKEDLRNIFANPETNHIYVFDRIGDSIEAKLWQEESLPEEFLPEAGFKYEKALSNNEIIFQEALEKKNAIVHLALSDNNDSSSIEANDFSEIIKYYQAIIQYGFKKELSKQSPKVRKLYSLPYNYKLRAFASSPGSFNLHMFSTSQVDLFGNSIIELALKKFDEIIADFNNIDEYIKSLRSVRGHTVSSLKNLIKKLIECNITINHKWFSSGQDHVHFSTLDIEKAKKIYDILTMSEELSEERKEFQGNFVQVDIEKGTWRINNTEDNKEYSGDVIGDLLQGIIIETATYKIECQEIIEELKVAETERVRYILLNIERLT